MKIKNLRYKLNNSIPTIGGWIQINSVENVNLISSCEIFDWVVIDLEHGSISISDLPNLINVIRLNNKIPLVRIPEISKLYISRVLDAGFDGIILPNLKSLSEFESVSDYFYYPPKGKRGVGYSHSNLYGKNFEAKKLNKFIPIIIAQIENKEVFKDLNVLMKHKLIDAFFIGPYDLSASLNITGDFKNKKYIKYLNNFKKSAKQYKKPIGIHCINTNEKNLNKIIKDNFCFIAYSTDAQMLINSLPSNLASK